MFRIENVSKNLDVLIWFYIENNECINKFIPCRTRKERYEANKEEIKDKMKEYQKANRERINKYMREYQRAKAKLLKIL